MTIDMGDDERCTRMSGPANYDGRWCLPTSHPCSVKLRPSTNTTPRASGASAAERLNCPSWTVARVSFTSFPFLGQRLDKVGFEALLNDDN